MRSPKKTKNKKLPVKIKTAPAVEKNHALEKARMKCEHICEIMHRLDHADDATLDSGNEKERDAVETEIQEFPLSFEMRSGWETSAESFTPAEYRICLCTGGPAVQIVGKLDEHRQPESAVIQYTDWFTGWTDFRGTTHAQDEAILAFARHFHFAE